MKKKGKEIAEDEDEEKTKRKPGGKLILCTT